MSFLCVNNDIARGRNRGKDHLIVYIKSGYLFQNMESISFLDFQVNGSVRKKCRYSHAKKGRYLTIKFNSDKSQIGYYLVMIIFCIFYLYT